MENFQVSKALLLHPGKRSLDLPKVRLLLYLLLILLSPFYLQSAWSLRGLCCHHMHK